MKTESFSSSNDDCRHHKLINIIDKWGFKSLSVLKASWRIDYISCVCESFNRSQKSSRRILTIQKPRSTLTYKSKMEKKRFGENLNKNRKQRHTSQVDTCENKTRWRDKDTEELELGWLLQTVLQIHRNDISHILAWEDPGIPGKSQRECMCTESLWPNVLASRSIPVVWSQEEEHNHCSALSLQFYHFWDYEVPLTWR